MQILPFFCEWPQKYDFVGINFRERQNNSQNCWPKKYEQGMKNWKIFYLMKFPSNQSIFNLYKPLKWDADTFLILFELNRRKVIEVGMSEGTSPREIE